MLTGRPARTYISAIDDGVAASECGDDAVSVFSICAMGQPGLGREEKPSPMPFGPFRWPPLFDNCIWRKRSVGDEVLAGAGMRVLVLEKTLADYVFRAMACCVNGEQEVAPSM